MAVSSPGSYIETEVMTAPPQKLQLMLIEAAMRFSRRAKMHWRAGQNEQAHEVLNRAQQVISELLAGLNREACPELVGKVASVYVFVFRALMEASLERNEAKLDDAIRVLEVEQETWRQVCRKLAEGKAVDDGANLTAVSGFDSVTMSKPVSAPVRGPFFNTLSSGGQEAISPGGFSFEA